MEVRQSLSEARSKEEYQRVQAVWLRMTLGLSAAAIAEALGMHEASIWKIHSRFFKYGSRIFKNEKIGGRLNLTRSAEEAFLKPFTSKAEERGIVAVSEIHRAYERQLGRKSAVSTTYRLLARQVRRPLAFSIHLVSAPAGFFDVLRGNPCRNINASISQVIARQEENHRSASPR